MTVLVVYDSVFGNTEQVAKAIAAELEKTGPARLLSVGETKPADLDDVELLVIGSPTRGFRPTPAIQEFVGGLALPAVLPAAAFDTRLDLETIHPAPLRWVVEVGGYAAGVIQDRLTEKGCDRAAEPAGFLVTGTEGPLKAGEIERAQAWVRGMKRNPSPPKTA
jgi:flavodoxin